MAFDCFIMNESSFRSARKLPGLPAMSKYSESPNYAIHYLSQIIIALAIDFNTALLLSMLNVFLVLTRAEFPDSGCSID